MDRPLHYSTLAYGRPDYGVLETISASPYGTTYGSLSLIQNINSLSSW